MNTRTDISGPVDAAIRQQEPSSFSPGRLVAAASPNTRLYEHYWPPVRAFDGFGPDLGDFLAEGPRQRRAQLATLRGAAHAHAHTDTDTDTDTDGHTDAYGRFLHDGLASIYAHCFGYRDGAYTRGTDDEAETALFTAKLALERELFDHWIGPLDVPSLADQAAVADHLDHLAATNPGVTHPLFDYIRDEATRPQIERLLQCELIRNEVVDDEVALLVVGLQGMQKAVAAANLWDECGRGKLDNFHTYWLRRLLEASADGWNALDDYRPTHPWFAKLTSNLFAALLTRPSRTMMSYGCFLVFESWVEPHFVNILAGMERTGLTDDDLRIYFAAHAKIDPRHSRELSDGLRLQNPPPDALALHDILYGAHAASEIGRRQFDHMLEYLRALP